MFRQQAIRAPRVYHDAMSLWRVEVEGVSTRYVDAESAAHAVATVRELILAAIDIQATRAGTSLQRGYDQAGPAQRRRLLDDLDTLASQRTTRSARSARRRLARQVRFDLQRREWVMNQLEGSPPVAPDVADTLVRRVEMRRFGAQPPVDVDGVDEGRALEA